MTYATWNDVDFRQRKFQVTGDGKEDINFVPKNHEQRWIPLTTELYGGITNGPLLVGLGSFANGTA